MLRHQWRLSFILPACLSMHIYDGIYGLALTKASYTFSDIRTRLGEGRFRPRRFGASFDLLLQALFFRLMDYCFWFHSPKQGRVLRLVPKRATRWTGFTLFARREGMKAARQDGTDMKALAF